MPPDVDPMVEFIRAQLDADEQWALACNRPYEYADEGSKAPASGVHWQWVAGDNWDRVTPDPVTMEIMEGPDDEFRVHLATVEEWPSTTYGDTRMMPRKYDGAIEEMDPAAAGHIIRHDPARVLPLVAAHREILDLHAECELPNGVRTGECRECENVAYPCPTLRALASGFADRDSGDDSGRAA